MSFFDELKRRNVFRVGVAYVIISWLLAQVADLMLENFGAPEWVIKTFLGFLAIGLPLALFFAWAFELTPDGIKHEKDIDRSQSITSQTGRKLDRTIIAILALALAYFAYDKFLPGPVGIDKEAMELDPDLAESWAGLGFYWGEQALERDKAIEPLQHALEINPNLINANNWLGAALGRQGELRKAARIYEHMVEIDPLYRPGFANAIRMFNVMGQTAKARTVIERARPFYPNDGFIDELEGQQLLWESRIGEGLRFAEAAWQRQPNNRAIRFGYGIYLLTSQQFEKAETVAPDDWRVVALSILGRMEEAFYYMLRGNEDMALTRLEQAVNKGWIGFNPRLAKGWPVFRPLEGNARYEAVQQQILDHLNGERAMLELGPIELDRTL